MTRFHSDEYINFLQHVTPDNVEMLAMQHGGLEQGIARCRIQILQRCIREPRLSHCIFSAVNVGEDCPVFEGLFEFCSISAGGTIGMT